jgi:hypothetical protein
VTLPRFVSRATLIDHRSISRETAFESDGSLWQLARVPDDKARLPCLSGGNLCELFMTVSPGAQARDNAKTYRASSSSSSSSPNFVPSLGHKYALLAIKPFFPLALQTLARNATRDWRIFDIRTLSRNARTNGAKCEKRRPICGRVSLICETAHNHNDATSSDS